MRRVPTLLATLILATAVASGPALAQPKGPVKIGLGANGAGAVLSRA